jgi:hypothetical protein
MIRKSMAYAAAIAVMAAPLFAATSVAAAPASPTFQDAGAAAPSRQDLAKQILGDKGVTLLNSHVGGQNDPDSTARQNIEDTSNGRPARTSPWSDVGVKKVELSANLLEGMVSLGKDYDFRVTTIAGGDHSSGSYHYAGTAVDIDQIDGKAVGAGNPKVAKVKSACKRLGAVEILGPGDPGHDTHVHCAWKS